MTNRGRKSKKTGQFLVVVPVTGMATKYVEANSANSAGVAAVKNGRSFLGCDIQDSAVVMATSRLLGLLKETPIGLVGSIEPTKL
jgi:hypothetical protein